MFPLHPFVFPTGDTVRMCEFCCTNLYKKFHKARKGPPEINDSTGPVKRHKRKDIGKPTIRRLFEAQDGKCVFCHVDLDQFHVDHIIPIARGGGNGENNLQLLCPKCNLSKRDKDPAMYMMEVGIVSKQDIFILSGRRR
jgi:CRISPR/Cas system Type II protein with McrA/HNH and RuvC-like nuclease domain